MLKPSFCAMLGSVCVREARACLGRLLVLLLEVKVEDCIVQRATHEELEGQVVRPLGLLARILQLGVVPIQLYASSVSRSCRRFTPRTMRLSRTDSAAA